MVHISWLYTLFLMLSKAFVFMASLFDGKYIKVVSWLPLLLLQIAKPMNLFLWVLVVTCLYSCICQGAHKNKGHLSSQEKVIQTEIYNTIVWHQYEMNPKKLLYLIVLMIMQYIKLVLHSKELVLHSKELVIKRVI